MALTAPYMHNGAYRTLEQVVDFYNRRAGAAIGIELENQMQSAWPGAAHSRRAWQGGPASEQPAPVPIRLRSA